MLKSIQKKKLKQKRIDWIERIFKKKKKTKKIYVFHDLLDG